MDCIGNFKLELMDTSSYPSILIIGKRSSGKTVLIDNILQYFEKRYNSDTTIFCPREKFQPFYKPKYPNATIKYSFDNDSMREILNDATIMLEGNYNTKTKIVVFDDCLVNHNWREDVSISQLLFNGRNYRIPYILCMQSPLTMTPYYRHNFDYIFLLKENSTIVRKRLWDYTPMFQTQPSFEKIFDECTKDYGIMVIDNTNNKVFSFKAKYDGSETESDSEYTSDSDECSETVYWADNNGEKIKPNNELPILPEPCPITRIYHQSEEPNTNFKINYHEDNYDISLSTDNLNNCNVIKTICDHIINLKNIKIEHMKLVNENFRLRMELNKSE